MEKKLNILYVCDEYPPCKHGGIGSVTQNLARQLVRQGHRVAVCGFYPYYRAAKEYEVDQGVIVHRKFYGNYWKLKLSKRNFWGNLFTIKAEFEEYTVFLKEIIEKQKIDIIEMPDFNEAFRYSGPQFISFPKFAVPTIVKLHGNYTMDAKLQGRRVNEIIFVKEKQQINNANAVIAVSNYMKTFVKDEFNVEKNITTIYNGINLDAEMQFNYKPEKKTVVFAGRLTVEKGIFSLLKAWEIVQKSVQDAELLLYGQSEEDAIAAVEKLNNPNIKIRGFVSRDELFKQFRLASCAIFPSFLESFGMIAIEAMALGCPVIFTKLCSGPEIITDKVDGILIDPKNIEEIAESIIGLLSDEEYAKKMAYNGYLKARSNFAIDKIALQHVEFYNHVLSTSIND